MRSRYNYIAVTVLRLSRREFYRMNPGMFFDMVQIYNDAHNPSDSGPED